MGLIGLAVEPGIAIATFSTGRLQMDVEGEG